MGCDTTSRLFGIGKGSILKKFKANSALQQAADVFDSTSSTLGEIESAGEKAMVAIYNGKKNDAVKPQLSIFQGTDIILPIKLGFLIGRIFQQ